VQSFRTFRACLGPQKCNSFWRRRRRRIIINIAASSDGGLKPSAQTPPRWHQVSCAQWALAFTVTLWQSGFKGYGN